MFSRKKKKSKTLHYLSTNFYPFGFDVVTGDYSNGLTSEELEALKLIFEQKLSTLKEVEFPYNF